MIKQMLNARRLPRVQFLCALMVLTILLSSKVSAHGAGLNSRQSSNLSAFSCASAEVNGDGVVDISDVISVGSKYGQMDSAPNWLPQDVNQDGVVNILDVILVGKCQGYVISTPTSTATATATATSTPTPSEPVATMSVSPAILVVSPGAQVNLNIVLSSNMPTRGAQAGISFDSSILNCTQLGEGTFYSTWAASNGGSTLAFPTPTYPTPNPTQPSSGQIGTMGVSILNVMGTPNPNGGVGGATGSGVFLTLQCTAKTGITGVSPITLTNVVVANDNILKASAYPVSITNGQVFVDVTSTPTSALTDTFAPTSTSTSTVGPTEPTSISTSTAGPAPTASSAPTASKTATITTTPTITLTPEITPTFTITFTPTTTPNPNNTLTVNPPSSVIFPNQFFNIDLSLNINRQTSWRFQ